jgi:hypothetical protein
MKEDAVEQIAQGKTLLIAARGWGEGALRLWLGVLV